MFSHKFFNLCYFLVLWQNIRLVESIDAEAVPYAHLAQNLSTSCTGQADCGVPDSVCLDATCFCRFGYYASRTNKTCNKFRCKSLDTNQGRADLACQILFGDYADCAMDKNACGCAYMTQLDEVSQQCQPPEDRSAFVDTNFTCNDSWSDCPANSVCNQGRCRCQLGYTVGVNQKCHRLSCVNDVCAAYFGPMTSCQYVEANTYQTCECPRWYEWDIATMECRIRQQNSCQGDYDCPGKYICYDAQCRCPVGYVPAVPNNLTCDPFQCQADRDCEQHFGQTSKCNQQSMCYCANKTGRRSVPRCDAPSAGTRITFISFVNCIVLILVKFVIFTIFTF